MRTNFPVFGSNTRFFTMFARNTRLVARSEWLLRLPEEPFLPVISHTRAISRKSVEEAKEGVNPSLPLFVGHEAQSGAVYAVTLPRRLRSVIKYMP